MIRSLPLGAALGSAAIVASALAAVWVSGHFQIFSQNRGLLQLLVAIPAASLVTGGSLRFFRVLNTAQMLWATVPVGAVIFIGIGGLGPGYRAWPWMVGIGAAVFIPWVTGLLVGSAAGRRRS